jgi:hypothetical protein
MLASGNTSSYNLAFTAAARRGSRHTWSERMGVKKTGKGRRKLGQKKRRMRARIRHRKG